MCRSASSLRFRGCGEQVGSYAKCRFLGFVKKEKKTPGGRYLKTNPDSRVVTPYTHEVTYGLEGHMRCYVHPNCQILVGLIGDIKKEKSNERIHSCNKARLNLNVPCKKQVLHDVPLFCGNCLNYRLKKHRASFYPFSLVIMQHIVIGADMFLIFTEHIFQLPTGVGWHEYLLKLTISRDVVTPASALLSWRFYMTSSVVLTPPVYNRCRVILWRLISWLHSLVRVCRASSRERLYVFRFCH